MKRRTSLLIYIVITAIAGLVVDILTLTEHLGKTVIILIGVMVVIMNKE